MVLGLHNRMPQTMRTLGEHQVKRAQQMHSLGGMHPHPMMFGAL